MVDFLNDDVTFQGEVISNGTLVSNGGFTVGPGGAHYGEPSSELTNTWRTQNRVQVLDIAGRNELVAWRAANAPITEADPLFVWRANGTSTGLDEVSVDGVEWYAESARCGDVEMTLSNTAPYGWVLLTGQLLVNAVAEYPALWASVSSVFREGSGLRLPNMRGRVPVGVGKGTGLSTRVMGDQFGAELVALTTNTLPSHTHGGTTSGADRSLNHDHVWSTAHVDSGEGSSGLETKHEVHGSGKNHATSTVNVRTAANTDIHLNHLHPFTTNATGLGEGHPNVQPSIAVNFKMKV